MTSSKTGTTALQIVVAANFTAEPVDGGLGFWLQRLNVATRVEHAPYDQVFQQLLDPASDLRANRGGIGLLLVRLQRWLAPGKVPTARSDATPGAGADSTPDRIVREIVDAIGEALEGSATQLILCFCPATGIDPELREQVAAAERAVADALSGQSGVRVLTSTAVLESYPCERVADEHGERLADMPYTPEFFSVLGTAVARSIYGLTFPAHKVLVLDCDDTLWGGLCGELGPQGVELTEEHLALQRFAVEQRRAGKLICLASRNNEADVFAVFDQNPGMVLTREDLTAWRINWGLKSESLAELASKLGLGLDSFVFIDDDPVQCAEVQRRFPQVLAMPVPRQGVAEFCRHIWPLDPRNLTAESSRRTGSYREHVAREDVRASSQSFQQFLDSLELEVDIAPLEESDLARATELTYRTNQFNLTGRRINEAEFRDLLVRESASCFGVRVRDRFGDYGLVGLMLAEHEGDVLRVPIMLLSCRSLGRGVEHRMVARLGRLAQDHGAERVILHCVPSERNDPAQDFLRRIDKVSTTVDGVLSLSLATDRAERVQLDLESAPQQVTASDAGEIDTVRADIEDAAQRAAFLATIPSALANAAAIHEAIHAEGQQAAPVSETKLPSVEENPVEALLKQAFAAELNVSDVPVDEGFFELGGHSLQAVQILSRVSTEFGIELDPTLLFTTGFTVGELAEEINLLRGTGEEASSKSPAPPSELTGHR